MESRIEKFTRGFFWVGYVVFLSASIPHVASYFRHFDPMTTNQFEDISYWVIAVAIAIVIDVSDVLVSIAVIRAKSNGATFKDTFLFWVFIFLIMGLSWFFNWQYNVVFGTDQFHVVDGYTVMNGVTIGEINPVIGSAFQLLILVYTLMAHKFAQKPKEKTLEELMNEANEMEQKAEFVARIEAVKRAEKSRKQQDFFASLRAVKSEALKTMKSTDESALQADVPVATAELDAEVVGSAFADMKTEVVGSAFAEGFAELDAELDREICLQEKGTLDGTDEEDFFQENGTDEEVDTDPEMEVLNVVPFRQHGTPDFPKTSIKEKISRKKLFTIAQAAEELQCTQRYVRELRKKGTLTTDESGLITSSSLKAYKKRRSSKLEA